MRVIILRCDWSVVKSYNWISEFIINGISRTLYDCEIYVIVVILRSDWSVTSRITGLARLSVASMMIFP